MKVDAVIPIRLSDCCDADGEPRFVLAGKPVWDITIGRAVASDALRRVLVAYDDPAAGPSEEEALLRFRVVRRRPDRGRDAGRRAACAHPDACVLGALLVGEGIYAPVLSAECQFDMADAVRPHRVAFDWPPLLPVAPARRRL